MGRFMADGMSAVMRRYWRFYRREERVSKGTFDLFGCSHSLGVQFLKRNV
jgi:hypothetical protein